MQCLRAPETSWHAAHIAGAATSLAGPEIIQGWKRQRRRRDMLSSSVECPHVESNGNWPERNLNDTSCFDCIGPSTNTKDGRGGAPTVSCFDSIHFEHSNIRSL
jgi:hypothetical protein